jgi:hypothetical protein
LRSEVRNGIFDLDHFHRVQTVFYNLSVHVNDDRAELVVELESPVMGDSTGFPALSS